ncbi:hypothetical protein GTY87_05335 [Streptomyces sp. SID7813]|uniref:Uncharacterized protein n=1 Tax=Streptomyces coelicolor (strain ATCC BAA-471 / A3(2) / M145) TaxID=100226 RepID=Q9K427_STRCO|nr:hypothetical protein [Streptomyces sp. SID7813]QFI41306.1 hypothetical protein FQ762_05375 [Streptomyces coelicolor A3(2)]THA92366.1 hypothetical protein E6R61_17480 [Streptomyces sp. LRa12]CAB95291.1 hypothetical protein SCG22.18 [Streptomyces coelicolor A3(2)]
MVGARRADRTGEAARRVADGSAPQAALAATAPGGGSGGGGKRRRPSGGPAGPRLGGTTGSARSVLRCCRPVRP